MIELTELPIDHIALTERVSSNLAGAVRTFLGPVREITDDRRTASLDYEAYPEIAVKKPAELEAEARRRWPVINAAIAHRVGQLGLGDVSVVVGVSCPHRDEAFEVCRWLIDTLKEMVPASTATRTVTRPGRPTSRGTSDHSRTAAASIPRAFGA